MFLKKIEVENLLSFKKLDLELRPLNVLIGANASGKSNLIRIIGLLKSLPEKDGLRHSMAELGPAWFNRSSKVGSIHFLSWGLDYRLHLSNSILGLNVEEHLEGAFERQDQTLTLTAEKTPHSIDPLVSALAEIRHPGEPVLRMMAFGLERTQLYREFRTGPGSLIRRGVPSSMYGGVLEEDGSNLSRVIGRLRHTPNYDRILTALRELYPKFTDVFADTSDGGMSQVYVREEGMGGTFSAASLSDGTLRFLCLLVILHDPEPPPLVCIEEPEVGLHPDAIRLVANLLTDAAQRTQLIVTTHSPALIDALSDQPESVIVCERDEEGNSQLRRLQDEQLKPWLEEYTLGDLWQRGEIGGNRW